MGARARRGSPLAALTPREREILVEMARGASNAAIADDPGPDEARRREAHQLGVRQARPAALRRRQPSRARGPAVPRRHRPRSSYRRHDFDRQGWIVPCDRVGRAYSRPLGAMSPCAPRPSPGRDPGPRVRGPAVVQTALAGNGARRGGGSRRRAQPLRPTSGARGGALRSADRRDDGGRVRRAATAASSAGSGWSCSRWPSTRRPTLDTLATPGLDALGQIAWAAVLVVAVYILLSFPEGRLPDRVARGVVAATALGSVLVWGALLATAERLPEFMPAARCHDACPRNPVRILGGGATVGDALAVASWSVTAGALIAVAVALTFRMRTAPSISRRTTSPILVSVLAVAGTFAAAAVARAGGAAPATLERLGWFSTATSPDDPVRVPRGHAGRAGVRRRGARTARRPAQRRRLRPRRPPRPRRRAGRPVAHGRVLACAARRVRRRGRPSGAAAGGDRPADPRPSSARTAIPWR